MNELKIKVIEYSDREFKDLYLYYLDKNDRIVANISVNNHGSLVSDILDNNYKEIIVSIINKLTGYNYSKEESFYIDNNEMVWDNTRKYIKDNNLDITYKTEIDFKNEELGKRSK